MPPKNQALPEGLRSRIIEILNRRLADTIDLQLQSRQASWNIKGSAFLSLRELFARVAEEMGEYANQIAARIVQLGGTAEGTVRAVAGRSSLDGHGVASASQGTVLASALGDFARHSRYASIQALELEDVDTAALFTEVARGIDRWLWFVETSQQASN